ncbi:ATP-binding protein [Streptomyces sp. NBC_00249]|uniref:ATP-binding protein n=1 Tax=Streptomyces sp. NBC_00249 TaxID=2975690 RepID=UPI00224E44A1|nr:ATP-binding protein [Streptomyces sp. NBC_00249]MCX5198849.1 ATP-binding protein [Streptomyces sp. NBC_00249]
MYRTVTTCQAEPAPTPYPAPSPYALSYSVTLPGEPYSAAVARRTVAEVLRTHRLDGLVPASVQVTGELMAAGWHSSPGEDLYLSVRYRDDSLRLIVYDAHGPHPHPRLAALCEARRRGHLRVLAAVVRDGHGEWGFGPAREPGGGTRSWAALPYRPAG